VAYESGSKLVSEAKSAGSERDPRGGAHHQGRAGRDQTLQGPPPTQVCQTRRNC